MSRFRDMSPPDCVPDSKETPSLDEFVDDRNSEVDKNPNLNPNPNMLLSDPMPG